VSRRGYTVVEVMMALAVLTLGASGVIAMQKATLISNTNARNLVTANSIAQGWIERLRVDALAWNEPNHTSDFLTETQWLQHANNAATPTAWFYPDTVAPGVTTQPLGTPTSDVMGADRWNGDPTASAFCTQIRLNRLQNAAVAGSLPAFYRVVRIEVRVFWERAGRPIDCTAALPADFDVQVGRYGSVYLVSAVLENAAPDL
jgi:type IV pilus assembly protein PilV